MDKKQLAAALAAGIVMGVTGGPAVNALINAASAASRPVVHAVDLRRATNSYDAGVELTAYATAEKADGGVKDIGRALGCAPSAATRAAAAQVMNAAANECVWP